MKKIILAFVVSCMAIVSCNKFPSVTIVGKWESTSIDLVSESSTITINPEDGLRMIFEFRSDNSYTQTNINTDKNGNSSEESSSGTYSIDKEKLNLNPNSGSSFSIDYVLDYPNLTFELPVGETGSYMRLNLKKM